MTSGLKELVDGKRKWDPVTPEDLHQGFKGWYASKRLPHYDHSDREQFLTYRLADSMPVTRRSEWMALLQLEDEREKQRKIEAYLDRGLGECHLRDPRIADVIQRNLWHHDCGKYRLLPWVVMPNHVHVLIEACRTPLRKVIQGWKSYTSNQANELLQRQGQFWAEDYFDRYIRDAEHRWRVIRYIEANPVRAGLVDAIEDWPWGSARYRSKEDFRVLMHPGAERARDDGREEGTT